MKRRFSGLQLPLLRATIAVACALGGAIAGPATAQDRADMDRTQIIGNRELPKVLYIVPWKKPIPGEVSGKPLESVLDEALAPVDRDVFRRQVRYDQQMQVQARAPAAAADGPQKATPATGR